MRLWKVCAGLVALAALQPNWSQAQEVVVQSTASQAVWPYTDFGHPGAVIRRTENADLQFVQYEFANGLKLAVRQTFLFPRRVFATVSVGNGEQSLPTDAPSALTYGGRELIPGGLEKFSYENLRPMLNAKKLALSFSVGESTNDFDLEFSPDDATFALQAVAAYLTDPALQYRTWDQRAERRAQTVDRSLQSARETLRLFSRYELTSHDARWNHGLAPEAVEALSRANLDEQLRSALSAAPLKIVVVGDINPDEIAEKVAATLGALPSRGSDVAPHPGSDQMRFPDPTVEPVLFPHDGPSDQVYVVTAWRMPDQVDDKTVGRQVQALGIIFNKRLKAIYHDPERAPFAGSGTSTLYRGYGTLEFGVPVEAGAEAQGFQAIQRIADQLANGSITEEELADFKISYLRFLQNFPSANRSGQLVGQISEVMDNPALAAEINSEIPDVLGMTREDLQAIAVQYLKPELARQAVSRPRERR